MVPLKWGQVKWEKLVEAADRLFHRNGFARTSLADIAEAAEVPLGNIYYYFKTREELLQAVVERRARELQALFSGLQALPAPRDRIEAYLARVDGLKDDRAAHGCPNGSLAQEANKVGGGIADQAAAHFRATLDWLGRQFAELGHAPAEARRRAAHVVASVQGAVLLANSLGDPDIISAEIRTLRAWLAAGGSGPARGRPRAGAPKGAAARASRTQTRRKP